MEIRLMQQQDIPQVFDLMKQLAEFEHYIDSFAITPEIVKSSGLDKNPPAIYMKELFVEENYRNQKVGEKLMTALQEIARQNHCQTIKWTVAPWNEKGIRFYERLGAKENREWLNYEWQVE